jgi:ATP-dependent RNA helicase UAP56/SUB2
MGEAKENDVYEEELLDYEEDDDKAVDGSAAKPTGEVAKKYDRLFPLRLDSSD